MTITEVQEILVDFLKNNVANTIQLKHSQSFGNINEELSYPETTYKNPTVVSGFFIPTITGSLTDDEAQSYYPHISVILDNDKLENQSNIITFDIVFGVYCYGTYKDNMFVQDGSGYQDLLNIAQRTKEKLFKNKIINKRIVVEDFWEFYIPNEQPQPFWEGVATIKVSVPNINYTGGL